MGDGYFSNITKYVKFELLDVPEKPTGFSLIANATRIGNVCFFNIKTTFNDDITFPDYDIYKEDRFIWKITHPLFQAAPACIMYELWGDLKLDAYIQGGWPEGRYVGGVTMKGLDDGSWYFSAWLPQTEFGRNGRTEIVNQQYPHPHDWENPRSILKLSGWYEVKPLSPLAKVQYTLARSEPYQE